MARFRTGVRNLDSWERSPVALVTQVDIESVPAIGDVLADSGCDVVILSEENDGARGAKTDGHGVYINLSRDEGLPMVTVGWPRVHEQLIEAINCPN